MASFMHKITYFWDQLHLFLLQRTDMFGVWPSCWGRKLSAFTWLFVTVHASQGREKARSIDLGLDAKSGVAQERREEDWFFSHAIPLCSNCTFFSARALRVWFKPYQIFYWFKLSDDIIYYFDWTWKYYDEIPLHAHMQSI